MELFVGGSFQGKYEFVKKNFPEEKIWNDFHLYIKCCLEKKLSPEEIRNEINERLKEKPDMAIICNELGCGIVPEKKEDRMYRELTGRILCELSEKAEKVFRITCGIPLRLK